MPSPPFNAPAFNDIAAAHNSGNLNRAIELAQQYIQRNPKDERAYYLWASALQKQGRLKDAEKTIKKALKAATKNKIAGAPLYDLYGQIASAKGDIQNAEKHHKKAMLTDKNEALYPYRLGMLYERIGKTNQAKQAYEEALRRRPEYADALNNLGLMALDEEDYETAETHFQKAIIVNPQYHQAWHNLSHIKIESPDTPEEAIACIRNAINIHPNETEYTMTLAKHYGAIGQRQNAADTYERASQTQNSLNYCGNIWWGRAKYEKYSPGKAQAHKAEIDKMLQNVSNSRQRGLLLFAQAQICEAVTDYRAAETLYLRANETIRSTMPQGYIDHLKRQIKNIKAAFNDKQTPPTQTEYNFQPIFIVGTMRCGSSLLEQILASHSQMEAAGETNHLAIQINQTAIKLNSDPIDTQKLITRIDEISPAENKTWRQNIADNYHKRLGYFSQAQKPQYITDKQLDNFLHIGWIRETIPNAKIIRCRRNSEDAALSIFRNYFTSLAHAYAYDINDIAQFFMLYEDLMRFWKQLYKDNIYELSYEELVSAPEQTIDRLMQYLNLKQEPEMLEFANTKRAVQTASSAQVRDKIHKKSIGKIDKFPKIKKLWQQAYKS